MQVATHHQRILSGMRPTGALHLGHYHGVIKNWIRLQDTYQCFLFVADWHALTTHYANPGIIHTSTIEMVIDWLATGIDPEKATIFVQSQVPEHAELHLLLSMMTPLGWLERVPTYKDQQEKLKEKDLATYGFLGYPLLQSADILIYKAGLVPVGEDQVAHVELTREVAKRFNHLYGKEDKFEEKLAISMRKMGKKQVKHYRNYKRAYQEKGDQEALLAAKTLIDSQQNISIEDKERLLGALEGGGKVILPEPQALLTPAAKMPGLDGQKMSKSYHNTISLREDPQQLSDKLRKMPTDPARVRLHDPGNPKNCPVWQLHTIYSDEETKNWVQAGCQSAKIGCLDCKTPIIDAVLTELAPIQERAKAITEQKVQETLQKGTQMAREEAEKTLQEVRQVMGLTPLF